MNRWLAGALVAAAVALVALAAGSADGEGTVVAKPDQATFDHACAAGGIVTGPVAVPAWGSCSGPRCWRLVVRDSTGGTFEPCVSRAEYDRTEVGAFWRGRTG
jgi:hypothetical protein